MDPVDLPDEVAENIFIFLPVEDILSCCLVSSRWRDAVNKNIVWKHICDPKLLDLKHKPNNVKPPFNLPDFKDSELSPLCEYRENYMYQIHLRRNFRNGRYIDYKFARNQLDKIEFLDHYVLLNDTYGNIFHIWDIQGEPILTHSVPYLLQQMCTETFIVVEDYLVIVQCNLLQVYYVVEGTFTLKMCRIFDKDESFSQTIPPSDVLTSWYSANIGLYPCDFSSINETVGNYFIGIVEANKIKESVMHIWDLKTGKKLKQENIPGVEESIETICCGTNSECLFIVLYLQKCKDSSSDARCKIFCYSLKTLQYTQFYVESNHSIPYMLFEEKVVILPCDQWENSGCYIFLDTKSGRKIVEKKYDHPINPKALDVHGTTMAFGSSNIVTTVDLDTQETAAVFPVDFEVMELYLLDYNMLLVGGINYSYVVQVWDLKSCRCLYSLFDKSILLCGRTLSRICLQSVYVHILHFW